MSSETQWEDEFMKAGLMNWGYSLVAILEQVIRFGTIRVNTFDFSLLFIINIILAFGVKAL